MLHDIMQAFEENFVLFLTMHTVISLFLALISNRYAAKRFIVNSKEAQEKDIQRLESVQYESAIFRLFFRVSLHRNNRTTYMLFIFLFSFTMPLIGIVLTMWIIYVLQNVKYGKKVIHTGILDLNEFKFTFGTVERIFGEGSMTDMMNNPYAAKSKKIKALSTLANSQTPENLKIIRETLSSTEDEIRMYGYGVINKAEQALSAKINQHLEVYQEEEAEDENSRDHHAMAHAAKELAFLYWEMVYTELAHDSLKANFITESKKYLEVALAFYVEHFKKYDHVIGHCAKRLEELEEKISHEKGKSLKVHLEQKEELEEKIEKTESGFKEEKITISKLYILKGRILMWENNSELAVLEFQKAYKFDSSSFILPYLAESYFGSGEFQKVKEIMDQAEDLKYNSKLYPIVQQWGIT